MFEQGGPVLADFAPLKGWLIAKLMWNVDRPVEPLLDRFFTGYYGAAAPFVRRYFDRVEHILRDLPHGRLGIYEEDRPDVFTDSFLDEFIEVFNRAEAAVRDDSGRLLNVRAQALTPQVVKLDRRGMSAKRFWVTRHPERFQGCEDVLPLVRRVRDTYAALKAAGMGDIQQLTSVPQKTRRFLDLWRYIEEFRRPETGSDRVTIGVGSGLHFRSQNYGRIVNDATALDGKAIEAYNSVFEAGAAELFFGNVAADADARYVVRFRAVVDRAPDGKGEAFNATLGGDRIAPRVEDVAEGWQWYAFKPCRIGDSLKFSFASGRFEKGGGRSAVKAVRIDRVEIVRADP